MAKKNPTPTHGKGDAKTDDKSKTSPRDSAREMIESVVIAFVLAFLFRTFEAEAFVIPTGSMAPTLMGRHKDLICSNCKYPYRVSASDEERRNGGAWENAAEEEANKVVASICPVCRYQMNFGPEGAEESVRHASFKGDRILVAKFPYEFADPQRWDVAVFKNPGKAKENYIKRVVGLPNETVVIWHGDVHTTKEPLDYGFMKADEIAELQAEGLLQIERKPPAKVEAMLQVVHDNNYLPAGMPLRWEAQTPGWETVDDGKGFVCDGKSADDTLVVYNHLLPSPELWRRFKANPQLRVTDRDVPPQLITDFYAYNTNQSRNRPMFGDDDVMGTHWVGDLAVDCRVDVEGSEGEIVLQVVEGGIVFECRIEVASGAASVQIPGDARQIPKAQTSVRGPGKYRLRFANVDDQLLLWVNGKLAPLDGQYSPRDNLVPTVNDLAPVRLGTKGLAARFDELRVLRDVYYIVPQNYAAGARGPEFFADPERWAEIGVEEGKTFNLPAGRFMVCGDNSPRSFDSRMWEARDEEGGIEYYVKRDLLVGKAVYIYWPHALDHLPGTDVWFPFFPNFHRMGFVR